jgi:peptidoglycan/xylan/chitin deacetylase (PgdA/CDA1 family)
MGVHDHALPVLASLGWPATVFLVAGKIGQQSDWPVTTRYPMAPHPLMGRDQLLRIQAAGISLQSHSLCHHDLTTLDVEMLAADLAGSRERIAEIAGAMPDYLAYPYGRYNDSVCQAAAAAGFAMAFTVDSGFNSPGQDRYRIRRIDVFGSDSPAMLKRKIRLGTNDGSLGNLAGYYMRRALRRV